MQEQYKITYTDTTKRKLYSIYNYIKYDLSNSIAAYHFYNSIIGKIQILQYFPYGFPHFNEQNIRYLVHKRWIILYQIKSNCVVEIQTIFNSKQNLFFKS